MLNFIVQRFLVFENTKKPVDEKPQILGLQKLKVWAIFAAIFIYKFK